MRCAVVLVVASWLAVGAGPLGVSWPGGQTMRWLDVRFGPTQSTALPNRAALTTLTMDAISTLRLIAASAGPDRARYRARSRSASRTMTGVQRPSLASTARQAGDSSTTATTSAMNPPATSSSWAVLFPEALVPTPAPAKPSRKNARARKPRPHGTARWRTGFGAGGCPNSAATTGTRAIARAGRAAAA